MSEGAERLLRGLGFRAARADEVEQVLAKAGTGDPQLVLMRQDIPLPATILNAAPLITYSGLTPAAPLGLARRAHR